MKFLFFLISLLYTALSFAQSDNPQLLSSNWMNIDSLPPDTLLYQSLAAYHQKLLVAQLEEYELSRTKPWLNYVPSVGLGYTPEGKPRPTVSFSLSQVLYANQQQKNLMAKRRSIVLTSSLLHQSERRQLKNLLRQYQLFKTEWSFAQTIFEIDERLYQFYETQHQNHEMTASQFLLKQKDFLLKKQEQIKIQHKLTEKKLKIYELCKCSL